MQQVGPGQWTVDTCLKSDRQIVRWLVLAPGTVWDLLLLLLEPNNDFLHFPIMKLPVAACGGGQVNAIVCLPGNQEISLATVSSSSQPPTQDVFKKGEIGSSGSPISATQQ